MDPADFALGTQCVHAGEAPNAEGAVVQPIYQSSVYHMPQAFGGRRREYSEVRYARLNNTPNHTLLADKISMLEGAEAAVVTASGMAAISTAIMALCRPGDHIVCQDTLYGGTLAFLEKILTPYGVGVSYINMSKGMGEWAPAVQEGRTKLVYIESISNPLCQLADFKSVRQFADAHGLMVMCDNTFGTPVNVRPYAKGLVDVVVHSATKYFGGHSDLTAGVVAGGAEAIKKVGATLDLLGATLDPHACFLLNRGLKTLALRVREQNKNAQAIAQHLHRHNQVAQVYHPGMMRRVGDDNLWAGFGGMLSFEVRCKSETGMQAFLTNLRLIHFAASLGGVESLLSRPCVASHAGLTPAERAALGIKDTLVRLSVGIEDARDLINDLDMALEACGVAELYLDEQPFPSQDGGHGHGHSAAHAHAHAHLQEPPSGSPAAAARRAPPPSPASSAHTPAGAPTPAAAGGAAPVVLPQVDSSVRKELDDIASLYSAVPPPKPPPSAGPVRPGSNMAAAPYPAAATSAPAPARSGATGAVSPEDVRPLLGGAGGGADEDEDEEDEEEGKGGCMVM